MKNSLLRALTALPLVLASVSCGDAANLLTGGNVLGNSGVEIALARQATVDNCCNITIIEFNSAANTGKTSGCGRVSEYKYISGTWVRQSFITPASGAGSPSDRPAVCPT